MEESIHIFKNNSLMTVSLNNPENHNALNSEMIGLLREIFLDAYHQDEIRLIVLTGTGRTFCAGADLSGMQVRPEEPFEENVANAEDIFDLMLAIDECPKPVIGRVNGSAFGGGLGLISCCDIVIAVDGAKFAFSEVRLGIIPAVISPFVLSKIGPGFGRELFLTGQLFDANYANRIGLIHEVVKEDDLDDAVRVRVKQLMLSAPGAQSAVKDLIKNVSGRPKEDLREVTSMALAYRSSSIEGEEGIKAFLEKRKPKWQNSETDV